MRNEDDSNQRGGATTFGIIMAVIGILLGLGILYFVATSNLNTVPAGFGTVAGILLVLLSILAVAGVI